jgi:methylmalonyl-CoA mutase
MFEEFPDLTRTDWLKQAEKDLKGVPLDKLNWQNESGIPLKAIYEATDLPAGLENEFPSDGINRRGHTPWMFAGQPWEICVEIPLINPMEAVDALANMEHAPDAVRFVLPTSHRLAWFCPSGVQTGPMSLTHWQKLMAATAGKGWTVHLDASQSGFGHFAAMVKACRKSGIPIQTIKGSGGAGVLSAVGVNPVPDQSLVNWMEDGRSVYEFVRGEMPLFNPVVVDLEPFSLVGANQVQELAYGLSMAVQYAASWTTDQAGVADLFRRLVFRFPVSNDFFAEISRLRAFRMLWSRVVQAYSLDSTDASFTRVHTTGSRRHQAGLDMPTNILRGTTQAMSAILGGSESVSVPAFDERSGRLNELSLRLSANMQRVIRHESAFDFVVDPSAGSYYVESLTDAFAQRAWEGFQDLEKAGGFIACLQSGSIAQTLSPQLQKRKNDIHKGKITVLGVNQYPDLGQPPITSQAENNRRTLDASPLMQQALTSPLKGRFERVLEVLEEIELEQAWVCRGLIQENTVLPEDGRDAATFEQLRLATAGQELKPAFLLQFGDLAMRQARANFSLNLLGTSGLACRPTSFADDFQAAVEECIQLKPDLVVLCASDVDYKESVPLILETIKPKLPNTRIVLAGRPEGWEQWTHLGLQGIIFLGMDRYQWLADTLSFLTRTNNPSHAS